MPKYIMLGHLTDQGVRHAKEAPKRRQVFLDLAKTFGATVEAVYWTMGQYDFVVIIDAPDDTAMTTLSISLGVRGNGRTQTLRAFEDAEVAAMLKNVVTPQQLASNLGGYRTDITEEQLRGAPSFYRDRDYDWSDRRREQELHDYWRTPNYWGT